jgi:hypothetical protein
MEDFVSKIQIAEDASSLELLQAIYRSPYAPLSTRMRAAFAALPFEHPKLAVTALVPDDGRFAEQLERALAASGKVLELRKVEELPQTQASTDVTLRPSVPDRRFRR